ncbi:class I SAM-dependent DNA methyltransferase [Ancylobacter oerskovii]|uniref:Class I SAM-dependent DNA methyltransferase n=1 Tax=Ancylobacter oerskovii TaxID=459519 RepID=A0ABW4YX88_9HYPH|nr:class I SAM-dependent methyltransferase [Ancylobacter oerskovii]
MTDLSDRIVDLYRRHAQAWAGARTAMPPGAWLMEEAWLARFLALVTPGAALLDIGCGPGLPIAGHLVAHGHRVTGIDSAPEMIALFRANLPEAEARVADMRELALGRRFGGLIAWDSFFHLSPGDQRRMFAIFAAHAEPGAPLLFTSGPAAGEAIGTLEGEPLYHASLDPAEYRARLDEAGFDLVAHRAEDPGCGGHTVWLARRR